MRTLLVPRSLSRILLWSALSVLTPVQAWADPKILVVDHDGKLHSLKLGRSMLRKVTAAWQEVPDSALTQSGFLTAPSARVNASTQQVEIATGNSWRDSGLNPPPPGIVYREAVADSAGNTIVMLGGQGQGFNYIRPNAKPILARNIQWSSPPPTFKQFLPIPNASAWLALADDGSLWRVFPPDSSRREFVPERVSQVGTFEKLHSFGNEILGSSKQRGLSLISGLDSRSAGSIKDEVLEMPPNAVPQGQHVFQVFSSQDDLKAIQGAIDGRKLQTFVAQRPPTNPDTSAAGLQKTPDSGDATIKSHAVADTGIKQQVNTPPKTSNLQPGEKLEKRDGRIVRIGADGNVIRPPDSVLELIKGDKQFAPFIGGLLPGEQGIINDRAAMRRYLDEEFEIIGRDKELGEILKVLVRVEGKNPVMTAEAGVGKTAIMEKLGDMIVDGKFPEAKAFEEDLKDAILVQTTPSNLSKLAKSNDNTSQAAAVEDFVEALLAAQKKLDRKIIVMIDEIHMLNEGQLNALKPYMASKSSAVHLVGATTNWEYERMVGKDKALDRRVERINVPELSFEETKKVLKSAWVPLFERKYRGRDGKLGVIEDEAIDAAIRLSKMARPDIAYAEGPIKLLQDAMISAHKDAGATAPVLTGKMVGEQVIDRLRLPLNPYDPDSFYKKLDELREILRDRVVDQGNVTDAMIDLWGQLSVAGDTKGSKKTILISGPTGAGKSFSGETFAEVVLGNKERFLEIDATKYATGGLSVNTLIGTIPGTVGYNESRGMLCDFLAGKGRGASVIQINELDKASPDFIKAIMELLDKGYIQGGDGKTYYLGKSLIVFTSNKGSDQIFPPNETQILTREVRDNFLSQWSDENKLKKLYMQPEGDDLYDTSKNLPASTLERINRSVAALPPSHEGAYKIAKQEVERISKQKRDGLGFTIDLDEKAIQRIVDSTYVPEKGVRSVIDRVTSVIEDTIAVAHRSGFKLATGQQLTVTLAPSSDGINPDKFEIRSNLQDQVAKITAPAPRSAVENPLVDPGTREKLLNLEQNMGKTVFGQDEAISGIADAVRSSYIYRDQSEVSLFALFGPTGNGKTELAYALAEALGVKLEKFDMGEIKWEGDLQNFFGSGRGFVGSNTMSPFENFLKSHSKGVILFDEISNICGGSGIARSHGGGGSTKKSCLKYFYNVFDKATWRSPTTGEIYNLNNYVILMTGNDLEEDLAGVPSDDLKIAKWKDVKKLSHIKQRLKQNDWPEPLVARLEGRMAVLKPAIADDRRMMAEKLVGNRMRALQRRHQLKAIILDEGFYQVVGNSFFSHDEGARSIRSFAKGPFSNLIGAHLMKNYDPEALRETSIHLSLSDNYAGKYRYKGKNPPEREVILKMEVTTPKGHKVVEKIDLTDKAALHRLQSSMQALVTSYHESGHVIGNDASITKFIPDHVTIKSAGNFGGYARSIVKEGTRGAPDRAFAVAELARTFGGIAAEDLMGFPSGGWASDLEQARKMAEEFITTWGLTDKALKMPISNGKVDIKNRIVQAEITKLLEEGRAAARARLLANWPAVREITAGLMRKGALEREDLVRIAQKMRTPEYVAKAAENKAAFEAAEMNEAARLKGLLPGYSSDPDEPLRPAMATHHKPRPFPRSVRKFASKSCVADQLEDWLGSQ